MQTSPLEPASFAGHVDLAAERLGGRALLASDEFFAPKENLLKPGRGVFIADQYTDRGKWMDGWESRRKRTPGHDWCVIRLGIPGVVEGVDIDTHHFLGNHPAYASLDACEAPADAAPEALAGAATAWTAILPRSPLKPGAQNLFAVAGGRRWTHVRLNIFPDGGVARLRIYGRVVPDWSRIAKSAELDLAALENGGQVVAASDMFFANKENLILPGESTHMGDGWETRRRRGPGHDWAIVRLGRPGRVRRIEVGTRHFKGNYPDRCSIDACHSPEREVDALTWPEVEWKPLLGETKLEADRSHVFEKELRDVGTVSHVRLNIHPDGGVSRLRVYGVMG
jgi:allantoicase